MVLIRGIEYNYNALDGKHIDMRVYFDNASIGSLEMLEEVGQALINLAKSNPPLYDDAESSAVEN